MSLRAFHIFFIAVSILMCGIVATWGVSQYLNQEDRSALTLAILCILLGGALMVYGTRVYRKLMELGR